MQQGGRGREEAAPPACRKGKNPLQLTALLGRVYWRRRDGTPKIGRKKLEGNGLVFFSNPSKAILRAVWAEL